MLVPLGKVDSEVRRLPLVTFAIIGICIIIHISLVSKVIEGNRKSTSAIVRLLMYKENHPYLDIPKEVKYLFPTKKKRKSLMQALFSGMDKYRSTKKPKDPDVLADQQARFEILAAEAIQILHQHPFYRGGLVPANKKFVSYITSMFMHADWWHLLFNLLFLYITGPFIEDAWGKTMFAVFYLVAGIVSAQMFTFHYPNLNVPLIGASGAIAGVMGVFMVRFAAERLKFFFWIYYTAGTFTAPAGMILPVFLALEFFNAHIMDSINPQGGGGVAHWVHVWGFVVGIAVALLVKYFKYEQKVIAPKIAKDVTYVDEHYTRFEEATDLRLKGRPAEAFGLLLQVAAAKPNDPQVIDALWENSMETGRQREAAPYLHKLVETEIRRNLFDAARYHYAQLSQAVPEAMLSAPSAISFIQMLLKNGDREPAELLGHSVVQRLGADAPPGILLQFASVALELGPQWADPAIDLCNRNPEIPESKKEELAGQRQQLDRPPITVVPGQTGPGPQPQPVQPVTQPPPDAQPPAPGQYPFIPQPPPTPVPPAPHTGPADESPYPVKLNFDGTGDFNIESNTTPPVNTIAPPPVPPTVPPTVSPSVPAPQTPVQTPPPVQNGLPFWKLSVSRAIPVKLLGDRIAIKVEKVGERSLMLSRIKMISVVKITGSTSRTYVLFDLFLDDPSVPGTGGQVRTVRLHSMHFDPRKFYPNPPTILEAYQQFSFFLINGSKARPFPHSESVQLKKLEPFDTVEDYERYLEQSFGGT